MSQTVKENFKVVGYYPCWRPEAVSQVNFKALTHINYAFVIPTADGELLPLRNPDTARQLIKAAHENGVKVMLVVGGWDYLGEVLEQTFVLATDSREKLEKLAQQLLELCDAFGFDGIDVDWEYPRAGAASAQQYEALMEYLSAALKPKGKLLSCAVFSGVDAAGKMLPDGVGQSDRVMELCDLVNIMAYDGGDGWEHSTFDFAVNCARYWKETRGVSEEKLTLGLPFYSRPGWFTYEDLVKKYPDAPAKDSLQVDGMETVYNGIATIRQKTRYAMENLGGVMIWEITQDSKDPETSLLTAIDKEIHSL